MPCIIRISKDKTKHWSIGQQPGTKSGHGPAFIPVINRSSCSPVRFYMPPGVSRAFFVAHSGGQAERSCLCAHRSALPHPALPRPASPRPLIPNPPRPDCPSPALPSPFHPTSAVGHPGFGVDNVNLPSPKPGTTMGGRGGAAHGGVAGRGGARQFGTPTDWFAQGTTVHLAPQAIEGNSPERFLGSTDKAKPIQTNGRTR